MKCPQMGKFIKQKANELLKVVEKIKVTTVNFVLTSHVDQRH